MNTAPAFTGTINNGFVRIPTTNAQVKSDGTSAGSGTDLMYKVWAPGSLGGLLERIRFLPVASAAAVTSVATVLRVYQSTIAAPGATTTADTFLLGEISVPAVSASHSTNANSPYELVFNKTVPAGSYIHVSQHVAQTTNQAWNAEAIGGNY